MMHLLKVQFGKMDIYVLFFKPLDVHQDQTHRSSFYRQYVLHFCVYIYALIYKQDMQFLY